jgi:hypothetical protein
VHARLTWNSWYPRSPRNCILRSCLSTTWKVRLELSTSLAGLEIPNLADGRFGSQSNRSTVPPPSSLITPAFAVDEKRGAFRPPAKFTKPTPRELKEESSVGGEVSS